MGAYSEPNTLRASSSAFAWGDIIYTDYKTGCLRKILIQSQGYEQEIDPKYGEVGALNEERHAMRCAKSLPGRAHGYVRELEFERFINPTIKVKGHADFVFVNEAQRPVWIDELKSVQSTRSRYRYIRRGEYLIENLAQLVCYLWAFDVHQGRLIYTFWQDGEPTEERIFKVDIDEFGRICVDSKPSKFTVYDLFAHQAQAADVISSKRVAQRPLNWDTPFVSPCAACVFKDACDRFDAGEIEGNEAFVQYAKECKK